MRDGWDERFEWVMLQGQGSGARAWPPPKLSVVREAGQVDDPLARKLSSSVLGRGAGLLTRSLGVQTVGELLRWFPRRVESLGALTDLASLHVGEAVTVAAEVANVARRPMRGRAGQLMMTVTVTDGDAELDLTFFSVRGPQAQLREGRRGLFSGTVGVYHGRRQLTHPTILMTDGDLGEADQLARASRPVPVYPTRKNLDSATIARLVALQLSAVDDVPDPVPVEVRARQGLIGALEAYRRIHAPDDVDAWREAVRRFTFEEAFVLQTALARRRYAQGDRQATPRPPRAGGLREAFERRLPFTLTGGQVAVGEELDADLARPHPMHRLLQGEVGSGKTVVALRAMLTVVDAGGQAALLAPTEVLAAQHHRSITALLGPLAEPGMLGGDADGTGVVLLTGQMPAAARRAALLDLASGRAGIVVGTHALLSEHVQFADLGLVVVDEQHRFGVEQRDALRDKGRSVPHLLVMTATPIPRTVAMTVFGDLETSVLTELPAGRAPIATHVVPVQLARWYDRVWQRVREEVDTGRQAYVVCPRIGDDVADDGDAGEADEPADGHEARWLSAVPDPQDEPGDQPDRPPGRAVVEVLAELRGRPELAGLRVEAMHGRMPAEQRDDVMRRFAAGEVDVLVATTVVEVGVDVANASVMVVLDADRFGVSQLHQLRGRVGRGEVGGVCLLVTAVQDANATRQRLDAVAATTDGFRLAEVDLEQRREGDVLGRAQHGGTSLKLLRVLRDARLIEVARHEATAVVAQDPDLGGHPALAAAMDRLLGPDREAFLERA